jgi:hypothetical protein
MSPAGHDPRVHRLGSLIAVGGQFSLGQPVEQWTQLLGEDAFSQDSVGRNMAMSHIAQVSKCGHTGSQHR